MQSVLLDFYLMQIIMRFYFHNSLLAFVVFKLTGLASGGVSVKKASNVLF